MHSSRLALPLLLVGVWNCGDTATPRADADAHDAVAHADDASADARLDSGSDTPGDVATDAARDAGFDAPGDVATDAARDAGFDAPADVIADAARDARPDVATDVPADAPSGLSCAEASPVVLGTPFDVTLAAGTSSEICDGTRLSTRFFRLQLPAHAQISVERTGGTDVTLSAVRGACTAACSAYSTTTQLLLRGDDNPQSLVIAASAPATTSFSLLFRDGNSVVDCRYATVQYVTTTVSINGPSAATGSICGGADRSVYFRHVEVMPGMQVTATSVGSYGTPIGLVADCGSTSCLGTFDAAHTSVTYANAGRTPQMLLLVAGTRMSSATNYFAGIDFRYAPIAN